MIFTQSSMTVGLLSVLCIILGVNAEINNEGIMKHVTVS